MKNTFFLTNYKLVSFNNENRIVGLFVIISLVLHIWYAVSCVGYYHPDEHYQILEFATLKIPFSSSSVNDLPWEFGEKIRSSLQPYIVVALAKILFFFNIYSPFTTVVILQLFASICGWWINVMLQSKVASTLKKSSSRIVLALLVQSMYLFPLFQSRFSSESLSCSLFIIALLLTQHEFKGKSSEHLKYFVVGLILGFSFLFRYQIAFAILALMFWKMISDGISTRNLSLALMGFTVILICGVCLDRLYYGEWVFTPWRYFKVNIIDDKASSFGVSPPWEYLTYILKYLIIPFSILFIAAIIYLILTQLENIYLIIFLVFLTGHSLVSHKEMRFLFPVLAFIPVILAITLDSINLKGKSSWILPIVFVPYLILNLSICISMLEPLNPNIKLYKFIYETYGVSKYKNVELIFLNKNPYAAVMSEKSINFYKPINLRTRQGSVESLNIDCDGSKIISILVIPFKDKTTMDNQGFKKIYDDGIWCLYNCKAKYVN